MGPALLIIVAGIVALPALILISPLEIKLMANIRWPARNIQTTFSTLWGAFGVRIVLSKEFEGLLVLVGGKAILRRRSRSRKTEKKKKRQRPSPTKVLQIISRQGEIRRRGTDLLRSGLRSVKLERMKVKLILGLPDPSDTGILYGYYQCARAILSSRIDTRGIELEPVFDRETFELEADIALRVRIPRLVFPSLKFFLGKSVRQLWR